MVNEPIATESACLCKDGTHLIPLFDIRYRGCDQYPTATGELQWHPERGVRLSVEFLKLSVANFSRFFRPRSRATSSGTLFERAKEANWTAQTSEGLSVSIFSLNENPSSTTHYGTHGNLNSCSVAVEVLTACVGLSKDSPLAFWHQTEHYSRLLCLGFEIRNAPLIDEYEYHYNEDGVEGIRKQGRSRLVLRDMPRLSIVSAANLNLSSHYLTSPSQDIATCWLVTDQPNIGLDYPNQHEKQFLSFLNGRRTGYYWHDSFVSNSHLLSRRWV